MPLLFGLLLVAIIVCLVSDAEDGNGKHLALRWLALLLLLPALLLALLLIITATHTWAIIAAIAVTAAMGWYVLAVIYNVYRALTHRPSRDAPPPPP